MSMAVFDGELLYRWKQAYVYIDGGRGWSGGEYIDINGYLYR